MWKYNQTPESDELMHYGVLGMRWGQRRSKLELARANRQRKASRKIADYEYESDMIKAKKKNSKFDKRIATLNAKSKRTAEREYIDQEYTKDVDRAKTKEYVGNMLAGAVGGTIVSAAISRKKHYTGKKLAVALVAGAAGVATLGAIRTAQKGKNKR